MRALFHRSSGEMIRYALGDALGTDASVDLPAGISLGHLRHVRDLSRAISTAPSPHWDQPAIWLRGHFLQRHSLAHVNRELALPLLHQGLAVHLEMRTDKALPEHLALAHRFPQHEPLGTYFALQSDPWDESQQHEGKAIPCLWDMIDTYRADHLIPKEIFNRHRLTLTPSDYSRNALRERGVQNVVTIPNGVNNAIFHPGVLPIDLEAVLDPHEPSFRAWGTSWKDARTIYLLTGFLQEKKNVPGAIRAWNEFWHAGNQDCVLLVKNTVSYWGKPAHDLIDAHNHGASVVYTEKDLSDAEFRALLARIDVLFQPSSLEGFGLIPLQAMAMGKSVVVTNFGGFTDFCTPRNTSLIEVYPSAPPPAFPGFPFCDFTASNGAAALQDARDHLEDGVRRLARLDTAQRFSWENAAKRLTDVLRENSPTPLRAAWRKRHRGLVSIIVTARGGQSNLQRLADSLQMHETWPYELLVVDDGSDPPLTPPFAARLIRIDAGAGAATGRNRGFLEAHGEYILTLDADIEIDRPVLGALIDALGGPEERVLVAPKLVYGDRRIQSAGGLLETATGGKEGDVTHYLPRHRHHGEPEDAEGANLPAAVQYAPSAAHFFGRSLLEEIGVYWEEYEAALWEDTHFCYALRRGGVAIRYVPSVTLIHNEGQYNRSMHPSRYWHNEELFRSYFPEAATSVAGPTPRSTGEEV